MYLRILASPRLSALFLLSIAAGGVATLVMDVVMARTTEGEMPPRVASGVLTETHPDEAPARLASIVHYLAGVLTGALYAWLLATAAAFLGTGPVAGAVAGGVLYPLMVGFFAVVVLPRSRGLSRQRIRSIRRAWALDAAAYVVVLVPLVTGLALLL